MQISRYQEALPTHLCATVRTTKATAGNIAHNIFSRGW